MRNGKAGHCLSKSFRGDDRREADQIQYRVDLCMPQTKCCITWSCDGHPFWCWWHDKLVCQISFTFVPMSPLLSSPRWTSLRILLTCSAFIKQAHLSLSPFFHPPPAPSHSPAYDIRERGLSPLAPHQELRPNNSKTRDIHGLGMESSRGVCVDFPSSSSWLGQSFAFAQCT